MDIVNLHTTTVAVANSRELVLVAGGDTISFLQGQLSQDIEALAPHTSALSLLLQPQGRLVSFLRVTRISDHEVALDIDSGHAAAMVTRLERFKLRTACEFTATGWQHLRIAGTDADQVVVEGAEIDNIDRWGSVVVRDVFGPDVSAAGLALSDPSVLDYARIEAGIPSMGSELSESTIPASAGIVDASVSFTKGCYTGQELVARIDSRGNNVPQRLCRLTSDVPVAVGDTIYDESGAEVGAVTSSAAADAGFVALGYVARNAVGSPTLLVGDNRLQARSEDLASRST